MMLMLDRIAEWVHASRRELALSFAAAVAASFLAVEYGPPRLLGEILGVINGVSGIYLGLAVLYLYRSSPENKKAIRFGHRHPIWIGLLGSLFLFMGILIALAAGGSLLRRTVSKEASSVPRQAPTPRPTNKVTPPPAEWSPPKLQPKRHDDCKGQPTCRACLRAPLHGDDSTCVSAKLREEAKFALRADTHGTSGWLILLVDNRWHRPEREDYRGHSIDEDDPLAAAVLRLVGKRGEILDEMEDLYPAVSVKAKLLGDGTETFLVTQEFLCAAGRYCGWDTRFIQVHEGKLRVIEAVDPDGKPEQAWFTLSDAAGWELVKAESGKFDILHQRFGFDETKGETDTQTRFYFWDGKWRSVSDTVYVHSEDREPSAERPPEHR